MEVLMLSENLDYGYLERFVRQGLCGKWNDDPGAVNIIFIQGATPEREGTDLQRISSNDNEPDKYNDTCVLARINPLTKQKEIFASYGTSAPGRLYTETEKANPEGAANLCWGQHPFEATNRPKDGRLVLQGVAGKTRFWRDRKNQGNRYTQDVDEIPRTDAIGQWFHPMGKQTDPSIFDYSAGCVGPCGSWEGEPWKTFLAWFEDHPKGTPVILTLWGMNDYSEFSQAARHTYGPPRFDPTLRMGIRDLTDFGPVRRLQELLKTLHHDPGKVDGDWMTKTQNAFIEFQEANGLKPDGVCGKESWLKLKQLAFGG